MGRDKALLPHPRGGTWLEATLGLLAGLGAPVTLLSGHREHLQIAAALAATLPVPLTPVPEEPPWEGPLLALKRLMERHPGERLLLCPVDMPGLEPFCLERLVAVAGRAPQTLHIAHDGLRPQPLLGLYPVTSHHRHSIATFTSAGGRALLGWLQQEGFSTVPLPRTSLRNVNRPGELGPGPGAG